MATEAELREALGQLETVLQESGLGFVIDQERSLAVEGVLTRVDEQTYRREAAVDRPMASALDVGVAWDRPRRYSVKTSDVARRPLAADERVEMLLDLIEAATAATVEIEESVRIMLRSISDVADDNLVIQFSPPEEAQLGGDIMDDWQLPSTTALAAKRRATQDVVATLDSLRAALGVRRGAWLDSVEPGSDSADEGSK